MKIEFVGGARTVTGSSYIIKNDEFTIMVDCGMFQGTRELKERNFLHLIYDPPKIDALVLTHAHIDHSGLIPKLVRDGFNHSIYATGATTDLCTIMLPDSAHIQEMDAEWISRKQNRLGREAVDPLYTAADAEAALDRFVPVKYDETIKIHPKVSVRFRDAGHILGSAFIEMWIEEKGKTVKIVFSGDVGSTDQAIIRDPETVDEADVLLIESTYGDRLHKSRADTYEEFKQIINEARNRKGNIVIPSFAIERTQEIIYTLGRLFKSGEIPRMPVYIDSPLAISATEVFRKNQQSFDDETMRMILAGETPLDFPNLHFTRTTEESKRLNKEAKGAIIISASGMCTAGRIKFHLQNNLYRPESSVVFVGFQAEGTLGRKLVDGQKRVKIYGEDVAVRATVHTLGGFSAHADRDGLLGWMSGIKNKNLKVFVVHGEEKAALSFAGSVKERFGFDCRVPGWGDIIDLATMETENAGYGVKTKPTENLDGEVAALRKAVDELMEKLDKAKAGNRLYQVKRLEQDINDLTELVRSVSGDLG